MSPRLFRHRLRAYDGDVLWRKLTEMASAEPGRHLKVNYALTAFSEIRSHRALESVHVCLGEDFAFLSMNYHKQIFYQLPTSTSSLVVFDTLIFSVAELCEGPVVVHEHASYAHFH